ncbi:prepilin-type N-terminal cleavage/methylation domain-containing protein [Paenibacillus tepidiphilus]|uniref:prepilin-type N-terminal cleavage/methylation domain-containing protein n=1 Tax=Paenibacillus tepidiphilus TaxID=2608683 RepID=UPI0013A550BF|nr:prepilin-type N-terminal cleavage/methylation domain-containing protein [Paenibacillus tepidiphilus]
MRKKGCGEMFLDRRAEAPFIGLTHTPADKLEAQEIIALRQVTIEDRLCHEGQAQRSLTQHNRIKANLGRVYSQSGFTLVEVLAAIVILSIVSLVLTSYFTNAMSYSKSNQNKTIMVNLARNALFYMEKQDFEAVKTYFTNHPAIEADDCRTAGCTLADPIPFTGSPTDVFNPTVNGIKYQIDVVYQPEIWSEKTQPSPSGAASSIDLSKSRDYLLPVLVKVRRADPGNQPVYDVKVEGYITDERIR